MFATVLIIIQEFYVNRMFKAEEFAISLLSQRADVKRLKAPSSKYDSYAGSSSSSWKQKYMNIFIYISLVLWLRPFWLLFLLSPSIKVVDSSIDLCVCSFTAVSSGFDTFWENVCREDCRSCHWAQHQNSHQTCMGPDCWRTPDTIFQNTLFPARISVSICIHTVAWSPKDSFIFFYASSDLIILFQIVEVSVIRL